MVFNFLKAVDPLLQVENITNPNRKPRTAKLKHGLAAIQDCVFRPSLLQCAFIPGAAGHIQTIAVGLQDEVHPNAKF